MCIAAGDVPRCKHVLVGCINESRDDASGYDDEDSWGEGEYTSLGLAFLGDVREG